MFFSSLQKVAVEKVHSSVIAWLFSDKNSHWSQALKTKKLKKLCKDLKVSDVPVNFGAFVRSITEVSCRSLIENTEKRETGSGSLDFIIEYEKIIFVFENKIKSDEGENQLKNYDEILNRCYFKKEKILKIYLTFSNHQNGQLSGEDWLPLSYRQLHFILSHSSKPRRGARSEIIDDYLKCLNYLELSKTKVLEDWDFYEFVFNKENTDKKINTNSKKCFLKEYVETSKLKTIIQKNFLASHSNTIAEIVKKELSSNTSSGEEFLVLIAETRGNGLIDIKFNKKFKLSSTELVDIAIQIQKDSLKVQLITKASGSERSDCKKKLFNEMEKLKDIFNKKLNDRDEYMFERINEAKSESSMYVSMSIPKLFKKIDKNNTVPEEEYRKILKRVLESIVPVVVGLLYP